MLNSGCPLRKFGVCEFYGGSSGLGATFSGGCAQKAAISRSIRGTVFANEAEVECARLLDYYGIPWEYEPHSFPLETDEEGRIVEAFTPDFFLPELELYLEVTVMKQSLVTRKNRKIRKFRERYPDIKVKLFTRRDFERLGQKYGLNLVT